MSVVAKKIPKSILIFGAAGHIGRPLAEFLTREAPEIQLSLVARSVEKRQDLQQAFPKSRVITADYEDLSSLSAAVKDIEGVFVISSSGTSEEATMPNLVTALKEENKVIQVIRLLGVFPEISPNRIPSTLGPGSLPIRSVLANKTFIWPEHRVPFIDPRDISEVVGRLFLSDNGKHIGAFHTMNNGHDWLRFREIAEILSDVLGQPIAYDGSYEGFVGFYGPKMGPRANVMWNFFKFEEANEETWALNNFVERTLGREPTTVRGWIEEHKHELLKGRKDVT
ncbi:hypothetical protein B0J13DRAFT_591358 [Dactylonectria estremocensis]|uniref:NAD(P)-binding domain-containing protein n=1 Tax=Dactylonectria estremocensis TaxID=1079267 RepID=A0A9P9FI63_9HYPO|nr:hypothetical protein B0J13DRAFT_591358 [Dactylonectria estremocensis]